jgi:excisionase family DNA binding protein
MQENLLTTEQVAQYLRIDKFTVYRLVTQGKIPAFKVGNQWRFKRRMVEAWLKTNLNTGWRDKQSN